MLNQVPTYVGGGGRRDPSSYLKPFRKIHMKCVMDLGIKANAKKTSKRKYRQKAKIS